MKNLLRKIMAGAYIAYLALLPAQGQDETLQSTAPSLVDVQAEGSEVMLKFSQLMPYDIYTLESPWRLVVEIPDTVYKTGFSKKNVANSPLVSRIRGYQFKENPLIARIILDLKSPVDYKTNVTEDSVFISLKKNEVLGMQQKSTPTNTSSAKKYKSKTDLLRSLPTEVVTLDFEGADVKDVIRLMAETSNINMIFGPEISGNISIHLKQVPFDEAFRTIMNLKGLVASQLGSNILRITTPDILKREREKAVVFTKTVPINYLKANEMQGHIQSVMASSGRKGTITVVPETNSLVITDSEEGISQSEILIAQLDKKPKQVMIESRIVEINLDNGFDIGVQWEYGSFPSTRYNADGSIKDFNYVGVIGDQLEKQRLGWTYNSSQGPQEDRGAWIPEAGGTGVSFPSPAFTNSAISFGFVSDDRILSATLSALVTQSKAKILSSPKVVTINGQMAKIEAVQDIPYPVSTVSNGVITNSFKTVSAGIILTVEPTINAENRITLKIKPESSFPTSGSTSAGPIIRTRNAQTTVVIKDGDTLVIGGLIDDQDTKTVSKVPLLGDIPIIGVFFRSNSTKKTRNELLVFVTPRIIRE